MRVSVLIDRTFRQNIDDTADSDGKAADADLKLHVLGHGHWMLERQRHHAVLADRDIKVIERLDVNGMIKTSI